MEFLDAIFSELFFWPVSGSTNLSVGSVFQVCKLFMCEAPAVQVAEHAAAILEDDCALGIVRQDATLERLARAGDAHSEACWR